METTTFLQQLLGQHTLAIWGAGIIWSILGIALVKVWAIPRGVKLKPLFWLNDNIRDIILGLLSSLVLMRLGDWGIHLIKQNFWENMPETTDIVAIMIVISGALQYWLHKKRKPISKSIKEEMHIHNENCKH